MSYQKKLKGLYVITDDTLTPLDSVLKQVEEVLIAGATIIQLRDKISDREKLVSTALALQKLCDHYKATFVLNDAIDVAIQIECDGLHIGKSDYVNFEMIRKNFKGIIGVSCYGDIDKALYFQNLGADYVAFGSFFRSPTKPDSAIVSLDILKESKEKLSIPVCAIGGIDTTNLSLIVDAHCDMVAVISDIWQSEDLKSKVRLYNRALLV